MELEDRGPKMKNLELIERCSNWIETQRGTTYEGNPTSKRKTSSDCDQSTYTDSEFDSISECGRKKRRLGVHLKDEKLHLTCEWKDCSFEHNRVDTFVKHVANHMPDLKTKRTENDLEVYVCQWDNCVFDTSDAEEIARHVNYHSYHVKLKCIGSNLRSRVKLPKCRRALECPNIIDLPPPLLCRWEECLKVFSNYQYFLYHVTSHTEASPRGNKVAGGIECNWTGCKTIYPSVYKLREHMRRHTKEKTIACPDCGATFANHAKFIVHCKRQIPLDVQGFQCSHCNKYYPTESILRDHMRFHVFNYKCSLCELSCESPASLAKHVRYRHVSTRTFPCQLCDHAAKSQQDLDAHMAVHTVGPLFSCNYDACQYRCKNPYSLDRHVERVHSKHVRWYSCHECPMKSRVSYRLTKHLKTTHKIQLPTGHSRFQYMQDQDGCYRLQLVRYEAIDEENTCPPTDVHALQNKTYKIRINNGDGAMPQVEVVEDTGIEEPDDFQYKPVSPTKESKSMPSISNILISIDDTDQDGNIIKSKLIKTQETTELPASDGQPIIISNIPENIDE